MFADDGPDGPEAAEYMAETESLDELVSARDQDDADEHRFYHGDEIEAPCPVCFESSGHPARVHAATWDDPSWAEPDPNYICEVCGGTGSVPTQDADAPDEWEYDCDGYTIALDRAAQFERTF